MYGDWSEKTPALANTDIGLWYSQYRRGSVTARSVIARVNVCGMVIIVIKYLFWYCNYQDSPLRSTDPVSRSLYIQPRAESLQDSAAY